MQFDTKIAVVLDEDLAGWQKANVTAFLISGISATEANRAAVASVPAAELDFAGIAIHADRKTVDKVLDKLRPHA